MRNNKYQKFLTNFTSRLRTEARERGTAVMNTKQIADAGIYNICWQSTYYALKRECPPDLTMTFEALEYIPDLPVRLHDNVNIIWRER